MSYGRAMLWGAVAGLLAVVLAVAGFVVLGPRLRSPMTVAGDKVLLVVASRNGSDESQVAQLIGIAQIAGPKLTIRLVDPMTAITVPGTTYSQLRDAYTFGGGPGVSNAVAQLTGGPPLPVITVSQQGVEALVDAGGGVTVAVPEQTSVFDGKRLFTFPQGIQKLRGPDVVALLMSAEFLKTADERQQLRSAVASGLAEGIAASQTPALAPGAVTSTLKSEDLSTLAGRLRGALPGATITPFVR